MPRPRDDGHALVVRHRTRRHDQRARRIGGARPPEPRPLRPHLRRPHRGRTGARLGTRRRPRRPLRPTAQLRPRRAPLPPSARRRDRRSRWRRRTTANAEPALRGNRPGPSLARKRARVPGRARTGRLPCRMMRRLVPILILALVALLAGCNGGNNEASTQPPPATTTSETGRAALERAVRTALSDNRRLSVYVLWNNRIPTWAERSTRGPALASLRAAAVNRQR